MNREVSAALRDAVASHEKSLAAMHSDFTSELKALRDACARADSGRAHLRREIQAERKRMQKESADLSKNTLQAHAGLEVFLHGEVTKLHAAVTELEKCSSPDAGISHVTVNTAADKQQTRPVRS